MGLETRSNVKLISIADGKIIQKVKEGEPGAASRVNKSGEVVWEKKYTGITGVLKEIKVTSKEFGGKNIKNWELKLDDGKDVYVLQVMYDSRYATSLMFALCNPVVDFSQEITINPWMKEISGKKKTSCYVNQGEDKIEWYFSKDDPKGMPEWKQITVRGELVWDNYDAMQFLQAFVNSHVCPQLGQVIEREEEVPDNVGAQQGTVIKPGDNRPNFSNNYAPDEDDLPF